MIKNSLLLTTLLTLPSINGALANAQINPNSIELNINNNEEEETRRECTFMYVGKNCSNTGMAIVARTGDSPKGVNHNMKIVEHNELANKTVEGINGFKHKMPSTTYRYIGTPRNPVSGAAKHWEVSCVNEMGVTVSATLSTDTCTAALTADAQPSDGITEDNLAQVVAACSATARQGVEVVANIMKNQGSGESNAIMIQDKDEVWYMELYTGHEYCAIKMPDDKCCTIGNEFLLNTLDELGINSSNKDERCILSDRLLSLAVENHFAVFDTSGEENIFHLDLFNTYAGDSGTQGKMVNGCHMRTWRGRDLYAKADDKALYNVNTRYKAFFSLPEDANGEIQKIGVDEIIFFMRDRFESILEGTGADHDYFEQVLQDEGRLRFVGTETAYQIHIMMVDPTLPKEVSATEWVCLSNSGFAPFVPINAGVTDMNEYYTHVSENFGYDPESAICIYRNLNTLAATNRTEYGVPARNMIHSHEQIWQSQYKQIMGDINTYSLDQQKQILTNYTKAVETYALSMSVTMFNQLTEQIDLHAQWPSRFGSTFQPLVNLPYYSWVYGWNYSLNESTKIATLNKDTDKITIDLNYGYDPSTGLPKYGKISKNDGVATDINVRYVESVPYIDFALAKTNMADGYTVSQINLSDFLDPSNPSRIVIPVVLSVTLVACLAIIFVPIISRKVKAKKAKGQQANK